ncbi:hypothetical protein AA042_13825 [Pseudomonas lundensis]|nr:hypothetical protein AA042_13825 [Pseudomonas lundensis]
MHVEAFVLLKPCLHFWMLVRGVVVDDQMQLEMLGRFAIDLLEKLQPFPMQVLALDGTDQASLKIIQRSEQGDGAMADIIVRLRADMPDSQRQSSLSALEGLNLAFFIATEHQCLIRRIQIQPNDVPEFLFEVWIVGQFEGACQVRLYVVGGPYTLDAGR